MLEVKPTDQCGCRLKTAMKPSLVTVSEAFAMWLHHQHGPVYIAPALYAFVELPSLGHIISLLSGR